MLRLSGTRRNDPVNLADSLSPSWGGRLVPQTGIDYEEQEIVFGAKLDNLLPNFQDRELILARDLFACVDGFRTTCLLTLSFLFGMYVCPECPRCTCRDLNGWSCRPEGVILGRMEAVHLSFGTQKSGNLHAHGQGCIQLLHQHLLL